MSIRSHQVVVGLLKFTMIKLSTTRCNALCWLTCSIVGIWLCSPTFGQSPQVRAEEVREYEVLVKGKPAGNVTTKITDTEDGITTVVTDAAVALNYVVYTYRYEFHGREAWQGAQLMSVDNRGIDDGTKFSTRVRCDLRGSVVEVQGRAQQAGPTLAMTTNYWHAPPTSAGSVVQLMDADKGTIHGAHIDGITPEVVETAGRKIDCTHYRIGGDMPADLWFDSQQRLVRQQTIEDGYPTESRLTRLTSSAQGIGPH
jgi:Family of unknown function (DUF6134)